MARNKNGKPIGTFRCRACKKLWDGSKVILSSMITAETWLCGDPFCGGNVLKLSDLPWEKFGMDIQSMNAYVATLEKEQGCSDGDHRKQ